MNKRRLVAKEIAPWGDRAGDYPVHLRSQEANQMQKLRGFKGTTLGPANAGRRLSKAEVAKWEEQWKGR